MGKQNKLSDTLARWWWPGNNVTKEELKREINLAQEANLFLENKIIFFLHTLFNENYQQLGTWCARPDYKGVITLSF